MPKKRKKDPVRKRDKCIIHFTNVKEKKITKVTRKIKLISELRQKQPQWSVLKLNDI